MKRLALLVCLLSEILIVCPGCRPAEQASAEFPARSIRLIVPFSVGGGTDTFARIIKAAIETNHLLPQSLVIVNLDGAGATIGSRRVKDAVPDGYTLLILHEAMITAKYAGTVNYGPEAFEPVASTGEIGMVIAVDQEADYSDLRSLMAAAAARPDHIVYAANLGAPSHFAGLQLEQQHAGARFRYTQFGGGADRFAAIKGGHVTVSAFSLAEYVRFRREGLKALAYFGAQRYADIGDIPTAVEQGYDLVRSNVMIWWVPQGTPPDRIQVLSDVLKQAMQTAFVKNKLSELKYDPIFLTGRPLDQRIAELERNVARVVPRKPVGLPNTAGVIVVGVCVCLAILGLRSLLGHRPPAQETPETPETPDARGNGSAQGRALLVLAQTVGYVCCLAQSEIGFRVATMGFVVIAGLTLVGTRRDCVLKVVAQSVVLSLGLHALFTHVFEVELP
ncbi:MAG: tripartite tricarboxylate transporter substrate binding protein [Planctomycetaceae bacterium]